MSESVPLPPPPGPQTVTAADGSAKYTVFDTCAVRISVEEGFGHRRHLQLQLVPRGLLTDSEMV